MFQKRPYCRWNSLKRSVADSLFQVGAIRFGAFYLKLHEKNPDAPLASIYVNLRVLRSYPRLLKNVAELLKGEIRRLKKDFALNFDCYADVPTAATPIVIVLSQLTNTPVITPRENKAYGPLGNIDGIFDPGQAVLLLDDLITKADSKIEAIRILESNRLTVRDVLVFIDRGQGGAEQLKEFGYNLYSVFKLSELLYWYLYTKKINQKKYDEIMNYLQEN